MFATILGALAGQAGKGPTQAGYQVEEQPVGQMQNPNQYSPESMVVPREERKRQQPMTVLSSMGGGGYYQ